MYQGALYVAMLFWAIVYGVVFWAFSTVQPHMFIAKKYNDYHYEMIKVEDLRKRNKYSPEVDRQLMIAKDKAVPYMSFDNIRYSVIGINRSTGEYTFPESWDQDVVNTIYFIEHMGETAQKVWLGFCIFGFVISGVAVVRARERAGMNPFMD